MLEIKNISKTFNAGTINEKRALKGVSLTLNDGDFVTVIGGNGAGKSTLLNAICGTWRIDDGEIIIDGKDVTLGFDNLDDYKNGVYISNNDLCYYYPFKVNNQNLARHTVALTYLFETLYKNRDKCFNDGILNSLHMGNDTKYFFIGLDNERDYLATLAHSEMYNVLTCVPPNKLQSVLDVLDIQIPANKLRNAFMHGTFFFDRIMAFCLYDGKKKTEQMLTHIGNIDIPEIYNIIDLVQSDRFKDIYNEPEKFYNITN